MLKGVLSFKTIGIKMLHYEQSCKDCGKLQKRIHVETYQVQKLYREMLDNCRDCGSDNLKTELKYNYRI